MMDRLIGTLIWLGVLGLVASLAVVLLFDDHIEHVEFDGSPAERADVERVIQDRAFGTNMAQLGRLLVEELPWIRTVRLRFQWPDTVHVDVEREAIVARWNQEGFLTTDGKLVSRPVGFGDARAATRAALPVLRINRSSPAEGLAAYHALGAPARAHDLDIIALSESSQGNWTVQLSGGLEVMLGRHALRERFKHFLLVYQRELRERAPEIDKIDARYASGVAVSWIAEAPAEIEAEAPAEIEKASTEIGKDQPGGPKMVDRHLATGVSPTESL